MKKLILFVASIIWLLWGCTSEDPAIDTDVAQGSKAALNIRTPEDAIAIAESSYSNFFNIVSRSEISADKNVIAVPSQSCHNARSGSDTLIYIVNFNDDKGFAIVNALKVGQPLIGISDKGNYNLSDPNANPPGLEMFINDCQEISSNVVKRTSLPFDSLRDPYEWEDLVVEVDTLENSFMEPKVKAIWYQHGYFGQYCPNGLVGCGPLAIGAALTVFKPFNSITLTFPNAPKSVTSLDWDGMIGLGGLNPSIVNAETAEMAALYLRQIGHIAIAQYYSDGTATTGSTLYSATKYLCNGTNLDVAEFSDGFKYPVIQRYLIKKGVVIMWSSPANGFGHAWLVDGYKYCSVRTTNYSISASGVKTILNQHTVNDYYMHINWGWGGKSNGYFNIMYMHNELNPAKPNIPDVAGQPNASNDNVPIFDGDYGYFYIFEK